MCIFVSKTKVRDKESDRRGKVASSHAIRKADIAGVLSSGHSSCLGNQEGFVSPRSLSAIYQEKKTVAVVSRKYEENCVAALQLSWFLCGSDKLQEQNRFFFLEICILYFMRVLLLS
ncbi:hypothetical protein CDAR_421471 [Caerostris darwini]|uniref:Uncharacterized protein n=1 Tax=Caerostris darwini TaxID=1538125 RepID=A0AAV4SUF2_9ARAC|nr:hypothetical protein CDAR_421471 [Caerostris darwini]